MKRKVLFFGIFVAALGLVIACNQIASGSGEHGEKKVENKADVYTGGQTDDVVRTLSCTHVFPSGDSSWSSWEYVGIVGENHSHRSRCAICGSEFIEQCNSSSGCNICGRKVVVSDIDSSAGQITINEEIEKLVIVANKSFENSEALKKYIQYKKDRKFNVVEKYFPTNSEAKEIRAELKKEYEGNPSMAVLIVGKGVGVHEYSVPEFVNQNHPKLAGVYRSVATDFYYGFYDEGKMNLFPQVAVGRLSARNENDLNYQVEKIMAMEAGKIENKNIVLVQHKTVDGKTYFDDEPRDIKKHFETNFAGQYAIKETFTNEPSGIVSAINDGALLVTYSGHGQETSWGDSKFGIPNVNGLKNTVYPVVLGVTCNSANFTYGDGCMAEAFMRNPHGAVGYIGASAVMIADYSKVATIGQEVPGMINSLITNDEQYRVKTLGGLFLSALRRIKISRNFYGDQEYKDYSIEVLNLFGDPTMSVEYISK